MNTEFAEYANGFRPKWKFASTRFYVIEARPEHSVHSLRDITAGYLLTLAPAAGDKIVAVIQAVNHGDGTIGIVAENITHELVATGDPVFPQKWHEIRWGARVLSNYGYRVGLGDDTTDGASGNPILSTVIEELLLNSSKEYRLVPVAYERVVLDEADESAWQPHCDEFRRARLQWKRQISILGDQGSRTRGYDSAEELQAAEGARVQVNNGFWSVVTTDFVGRVNWEWVQAE